MKLAKDYIATNPEFLKNPGAEAMAELEKEAAGMIVPACPFCGGDAEIQIGSIYHDALVLAVACSSCGIGTKRLIQGQMVNGKCYSLTDRLNQAAAMWGRRV